MSPSKDDEISPAAPDPAAADAAATASALQRPRMGRGRTVLATLLCLANAAASTVLLLQHHGEGRVAAFVKDICGEGTQSGCEVVARSPYSRVGGIPLAALGLFLYLSLAVLLLLASLGGPEARAAAASLTLLAVGLALVTDVALIGVQALAIRAFCRLCLLTYAVNALALVVLWPARRDVAVLGEAVLERDGRVVLAAWMISSATLAGAVLAAEAGLSYREGTRQASILGPLVPRATPDAGNAAQAAPASEGQRYQEEARAAREQASRLQEILDDPQKLDQYFAEKAAREYEQGPVHPLKLDGVPFKGPTQAPIRVVEYSDFLCPYCRGIAGAFSNYLPQSGGRVAVYFKSYPLDQECNPNVKPSVHPGACAVALGALCAQEQGRFWPYHDKVFATTLNNPRPKDVVRLAGEAGLDGAILERCLGEPRTKDRLAAEIAEAYGAGVRGTPTLFINGKRLPRVNDFTQTVDKEAARMGLTPLRAGS